MPEISKHNRSHFRCKRTQERLLISIQANSCLAGPQSPEGRLIQNLHSQSDRMHVFPMGRFCKKCNEGTLQCTKGSPLGFLHSRDQSVLDLKSLARMQTLHMEKGLTKLGMSISKLWMVGIRKDLQVFKTHQIVLLGTTARLHVSYHISPSTYRASSLASAEMC